MSSIGTAENPISLEEYQGEKENKVEKIGSSGSENPRKAPSNIATLPQNNIHKNDFGPLSPVQVNAGNSHARSRQGQIQRVHSRQNYDYVEGDSLITEVAAFAAAEEANQLNRMTNNTNGLNIIINNNNNASNPQTTILDQSKKLVGFLGGSIRTALQQNSGENNNNNSNGVDAAGRETTAAASDDKRPNVDSEKEDPNLQRLNNFVGDLIGKLGSANPSPVNDEEDENMDHTNNVKEESPIAQPKSKYWETLMLRSEEPKDRRFEYFESPASSAEGSAEQSISSLDKENDQFDDIALNKPTSSNNETPIVDKKTAGTAKNSSKVTNDQKHENDASPQSMVSIPMDYSPSPAVSRKISPRDNGTRRLENNSPGSMMYNMISAATNTETPLVCKNRLVAESPAVSEFGNMISSAAAVQTPDISVFQSRPSFIVGDSPAISALDTPHDELKASQASIRGGKNLSNTAKISYSRNNALNLSDTTPIKCNKTEVFRPASSDASLHSDCDESEDGSIYTSMSYQSTIQSNTPRNRRVKEWLEPDASNTVSWPVPSMTTNLRSSETPERQLPVSKTVEKPLMMGTGQLLTLQKQVRAKRVPRPPHVGNSTSPTSLPSLLGSASCYEVSDLESPHIMNLPLNFKFSEEESTINTQSIYDASEVNSIPSNTNQLRLASPQSLMTVATTHEAREIHCIAGNENRSQLASPHSLMTVATPTVGYPTDEEKSPLGTHLAETFSMHSKASSSPYSATTNGSLKEDESDRRSSIYAKCIKRCIEFGMLVAFVGAVTVLVIAFKSRTKGGQIANGGEELKNDILRETPSPVQTDSPTFRPTSFPTFGREPSSTGNPISPLRPTTSKTPEPPKRPPVAERYPTLTEEIDVDPSLMPTPKPTMTPGSMPTLTTEKIQDLTWHRIINGENVWRKSDGDTSRTPLWYHADDGVPGIHLKVINAAQDDRFTDRIQTALDDYSKSKAVSSLDFTDVPYEILCAPPAIGEIKVCSGDYGDTDWIGSTILFMRDDYIVSALIRINEYTASLASDALLQYALCHQMGHSLGVVHNNAELGLSSCMKDFGENVVVDDEVISSNENLQHPNSDDLDFLVKLYGFATSRMLLRGRQ